MDIMNGNYAQTHFPCKLWDAGEKGLTLSAFEWEEDRKTLIYGQVDYMYGEALYKPEMKEGNPIRLELTSFSAFTPPMLFIVGIATTPIREFTPSYY